MAGRNIGNAVNYVAANRGNVPVLKLLLGVILIVFFLLATLLQIQTSEAFILNGSAVSVLAPNWGILKQPVELAQGGLTTDMAKAVMWGWGIELIYLVCVVGEVTVHGRLHSWFKTGAFVLVMFDFWTDLQYGTLASGMWGQVAFASITSFIVAFFGILGINMIWSAITEFGH